MGKARTKPVKGAAERMIRVVYKLFADGGNKAVKQMIENLSDLDATASREKIVFKETPKGWQPEYCAA